MSKSKQACQLARLFGNSDHQLFWLAVVSFQLNTSSDTSVLLTPDGHTLAPQSGLLIYPPLSFALSQSGKYLRISAFVSNRPGCLFPISSAI